MLFYTVCELLYLKVDNVEHELIHCTVVGFLGLSYFSFYAESHPKINLPRSMDGSLELFPSYKLQHLLCCYRSEIIKIFVFD